jgi:hypothetical protein
MIVVYMEELSFWCGLSEPVSPRTVERERSVLPRLFDAFSRRRDDSLADALDLVEHMF